MYNGEAFLFASYCHKDKTAVQAILKILTTYEGYHIYYDQNIPAGEDWRRFVATHMSESEGVLIFLSEAFTHSKGCQAEMNFIHFLPDVNIIPFTLDDKPLTEEMAWMKENHTIKSYRDIDTFLKELERVDILRKCRKKADIVPPAADETPEPSDEDFDYIVERTITPSEEKYRNLTLGAKFPREHGKTILINYEYYDRGALPFYGSCFGRFHSTVQGRIDNLGTLYHNTGLKAGMNIRAEYVSDAVKSIVYITIFR